MVTATAAAQAKKRKYFYGLGRRKEATASARLYPEGTGDVLVNDRPAGEYLNYQDLVDLVKEPLKALELEKQFDVTLKIRGGGVKGQAEAARLAITKALLKVDEEYRSTLKPLGLITTDARTKERKKYGLKKARKAPQYTKR